MHFLILLILHYSLLLQTVRKSGGRELAHACLANTHCSYVGVTGLVRRMALDRCLPDALLHTNKLRGTNHYIIIGFFLICTSLYFIMECNTVVLAGIYTMRYVENW